MGAFDDTIEAMKRAASFAKSSAARTSTDPNRARDVDPETGRFYGDTGGIYTPGSFEIEQREAGYGWAQQRQKGIAVSGEAVDIDGIYSEILNGVEPYDEDYASLNPLGAYISPAYHVSMSLTDAKPGSDTSYEGLMSARTVGFASTGATASDVTDFYNVESVHMRSVCSVTAANPELSSVIEFKVELSEPHGLSLDYRLRAAARELGFAGETPSQYVWRMDVWFSGYLPDGTWIERIPFGGFRRGHRADVVTHFLQLINLSADVKAPGTVYTMNFMPMAMASGTRPENLFQDSKEITMPVEDANLATFFDMLQSKINEQNELKQNDNKVAFVVPQAIATEKMGVAGASGGGWPRHEGGKTLVDALGRHNSLLQAVTTGLKGVKSLQKVGSDAGAAFRPAGSPNLSFRVTPQTDYSTARYDSSTNTYKGVTYRYEIEPFLEWKSLLPGSQEERLPWANRGVRRIYDYAWTPTNTEVINFNAKLNIFYYINTGLDGLTGSSVSGILGGSLTPGDAQRGIGERLSLWDKLQQSLDGNDVVPSGAPAQGRITGTFGEDRGDHRHKGIDIAAPIGTPVRATASGRVSKAGVGSGYGNVIYLGHSDGIETRYGHLSGFEVSEGDVVQKGQVIGYVGNTGRSTGPHLHYEVRDGGTAVDPRQYMDGVLKPRPTEKLIAHGNAPKATRQSDVSNASVGGDGALGRRIAVVAPDIMPGAMSADDVFREQYELAFERRIGPDLVKLEGMEVHGDPRWMLAAEQGPAKPFNNLSSLIIVNMNAPDQSEYMSQSSLPRQRDLNLGGYYEIVTVEHKLIDGKFTQILGGYRVLGLNGALPFDGGVAPAQRGPAGANQIASHGVVGAWTGDFFKNATEAPTSAPPLGMDGLMPGMRAQR